MFIYAFLVIIAIANQCYSMENLFSIQTITDEKDLKNGLKLTFNSIDATCHKIILTDEQKQGIKDYKENHFQNLKSRKNPHDIFILDGKDIVGFAATHAAGDPDPSRIILDNFFAKNLENISQIYQVTLTYIKGIYPQATKIWFAILNHEVGSRLAERLQFKKSDYIGTFHNNQIFQGWQQDLAFK